ncbi:MAG: S41 family peptidase [Massilibacteroides sp.]|nr:S41 family peptidase [Massilibacteroides sp.]
MTRRIRNSILAGVLLVSTSTLPIQAQNNNRFEVSKQLDIVNAVVKEVEMYYVDSVNVDKMVKRGIDAMLGGLDPYTVYYPEKDMNEFKMMTTGEYAGMGAYIRQRKNNKGVVITEPFEGMPAQKAGVKAGDIILKIDTIDVTHATSKEVSDILKGVPNTSMTLSLRRPNQKEPLKIDVTRKKVVINQVTWYGVQQDSIGYIYLKSFTDKSAKEMKDAFSDLRDHHHIKSLIIDLRDNGGGLLQDAVRIVSMFVPKGSEVISTKSKMKQWDHTYRTLVEPIDTLMPLAILINGNSASASEIVSGSLQDMDRAVLLGNRSFGKGLVQSTRDIPFNGKVKVTISKYYIPSGRCIQQLDYSHRNPDGSVATIPDSLTSIFHTAAGRLVRDGGGIRPDFEVKVDKLPTLMYYLLTDYVLFDFVTNWTQKHETIAPIEDFNVTDQDYEDFKAYAKKENFTYDRQSIKTLDRLKEVADFEGYLDKSDSTLLKPLIEKLTPNLDRDFENNKAEVKKALASEIIKRYYYQKGELRQNLKEDKVLEKAREVLSSPQQYKKTLATPKEEQEVKP